MLTRDEFVSFMAQAKVSLGRTFPAWTFEVEQWSEDDAMTIFQTLDTFREGPHVQVLLEREGKDHTTRLVITHPRFAGGFEDFNIYLGTLTEFSNVVEEVSNLFDPGTLIVS